MALGARQLSIYTDTFKWYRYDHRDLTAEGEFTGFRLVGTAPCKHFTTPNFDHPTVAGQVKDTNIMTSDQMNCDIALDLRDQDLVYLVTGPETGTWSKLVGAPRRRIRANNQEAFLSPDINANPTIIAGAWVS